jgi:DNA repair exonuclease SbcCD ATPase subunit
MYLKSISIENYRNHRKTKIAFDRQLTLIGGPNESGKSTLVEAAHRTLFLKAKGTTELHRQMTSLQSAGTPEVQIVFSKDSIDYTITKRFGNQGSSQLTSSRGEVWRDDEADTKLADLLGVINRPGRITTNAILQSWAHLWVWQGSSTTNPLEHANNQRDQLVRNLQSLGVAGVLQSDLDTKAKATIDQHVDSTFVSNERFKANSAVHTAEKEATDATQTLQNATTKQQQLQNTVDRFENAERKYRQATEQLTRQQELLKICSAKIERVSQLEQKQQLLEKDITQTSKELHNTSLLQDQISQHSKTLSQSRAELIQKEESRQDTLLSIAKLDDELQIAIKQIRDIESTRRYATLQFEIAKLEQQQQSTQERLEQLIRKQSDVAALQAQRQSLEESLATLPSIDTKAVNQLRTLDNDYQRAQIALDSMAASITLLASTVDVSLADRTLPLNSPNRIVDSTDIVVGNYATLRVSPGGGKTMTEARDLVDNTRRTLQNMLDQYRINTLEEAIEFELKRTQISVKIKEIDAQLTGLGIAKLTSELTEARKDIVELTTNITQSNEYLHQQLSKNQASVPLLPENYTWTQYLNEFEDDINRRKQSVETQQSLLIKKRELERELSDRITELTSSVRNDESLITMLQQQLGDQADYHAKLQTLQKSLAELTKLDDSINEELSSLQPEQLRKDIDRLTRAIHQLRQEQHEADIDRSGALERLQHDGSTDPTEEVAKAKANYEYTSSRFEELKQQALAWKLLRTLFEEEQKKLTDSLTEPLIQRLQAYIQCALNDTAKVQLDLNEDGFNSLRIARALDGNTPIDFDSLSGGAKEQIAAATRLAVAEVLAGESADGLPIIFDDSFSYSDSQRLESLPRMVERAKDAGLQVIIVTCNPHLYAGLGAHRVTLSKS